MGLGADFWKISTAISGEDERIKKRQKLSQVIIYLSCTLTKLGNPLKLCKNFCFSDTAWQQVRKKGKDIQ